MLTPSRTCLIEGRFAFGADLSLRPTGSLKTVKTSCCPEDAPSGRPGFESASYAARLLRSRTVANREAGGLSA